MVEVKETRRQTRIQKKHCTGQKRGTGYNIGQIKHQHDATLCRFYFCRLTLHVSGVKRPSSGVLKNGMAASGTCVIVAGRSSHHHIRDETHDDGRLTPETCRVSLQK